MDFNGKACKNLAAPTLEPVLKAKKGSENSVKVALIACKPYAISRLLLIHIEELQISS